MDFDEYQKRAKKTAIYPRQGKNIYYPALGLAGEAGEVSNKVGKIMRDDKDKISFNKKEEIKKEIGDVLWFAAQLATELDSSLSDNAKENLKKLKSRKKRGKLRGDGDNR
jgi:NTP pyrophosphatase (non-canonical NTP hydrolase)